MTSPIKVSKQKIAVEGKVFYTDKRRRIDLKKPIKDLFEVTLNPVSYIMELCLSKEGVISRIKELNSEDIMPVLLYFKEDNSNEMS